MAKSTKEVKEKAIEVTLWEAANKLRGSVEPAEYKHVVLGLIFLKFASDKFEDHRAKLMAEGVDKKGGVKQEIRSLQFRLQAYFGSKVTVKADDKGKGEIKIPFTSQEELDKILLSIKA